MLLVIVVASGEQWEPDFARLVRRNRLFFGGLSDLAIAAVVALKRVSVVSYWPVAALFSSPCDAQPCSVIASENETASYGGPRGGPARYSMVSVNERTGNR